MADINLIVARVNLAGGIDLEAQEVDEVHGKEGGTLSIKFPYKYVELSMADDSFRLQLTSKVGDQEAEPATHQHVDRRGVTDDVRGFILQEYTLAPGEHELTWRAAVEFTDGQHQSAQDLSGTVKVHVAPAAPAPL